MLKLETLVRTMVCATLVLSALNASGQSPFVQVLETGDLGHDSIDFGASWGDFDGDGDMDIFCTSSSAPLVRRNFLYRNDGGPRLFTRLEENAIEDLGTDNGDAALGVWGDIDNDGDLDLYVANVADGDRFNSSTPPAADYLYVNNGSGAFSRHTGAPFTTNPHRSGCASLVDYDRDGLLDIFVGITASGTATTSALYHNDGSLHFTGVPALTGQIKPEFASWADFDGDGDPDLITGDLSASRLSYLYVNESNTAARDDFSALTRFPDQTDLPSQVYSADWGDVDNDGDLDLLMPQIMKTGCDLFINTGDGRFERQLIPMKDGEKPAAVCWLDADNDGDLDFLVGGWSVDQQERVSYFENQGGLSFEENVIPLPGKFNGGPALADYDNDGFMDFFITSFQGADGLWRNQPPVPSFRGANDAHWLKLVLKGTDSNASAIGAVVRLKATINGVERWQMRHVRAGSEIPFVQHDPRPNFGLREATVADVVRIEWPSGTVQELTNVAADQILQVTEPPRLRLESSALLSWPVTADGYQLESTRSIGGSWSDATETVQTNGSRINITIQADGEAKFYRLHQP